MEKDGKNTNPDVNTRVERRSERNKGNNDKTLSQDNDKINSDESDYEDCDVESKAEDACGTCIKVVTKEEKALFCIICQIWFHISCVNVPVKKYNFLKQNEDIFWYCLHCNRAAKSLHQDLVTVKAENAHLKESLKLIEEQFVIMEEKRKADRIDWMIAVDRNEQYSRRDALRFSGIPHNTGETTEELEDKIIDIVNKAGVQLKREEISVTHRLRPDRKGGVPTIIKFTSRKSKEKVYFGKKNLKGLEGCDNIFITEDLTRLRFRTLLMAKRCNKFKSVSTKGGKIFIWREDSNIPVSIESPYDLRKLDVDPDWRFLGLLND